MTELVLRDDENGVSTLTFNRPEALNALSPALFIVLRSHLEGISSQTDDVGCVVLRGSGRSFSAGNDLRAIQAGEKAPTPYFQAETLELIEGYRRMQGVVTRLDEEREVEELLADDSLRMVNRNRGSGTRIVIDALLGDRRPDGYTYEPRSHHAVAAAVAHGRADFGITIEPVALAAGLRFRPLREERYDFVVPRDRLERQAVQAFLELLAPGSEVRVPASRNARDCPCKGARFCMKRTCGPLRFEIHRSRSPS